MIPSCLLCLLLAVPADLSPACERVEMHTRPITRAVAQIGKTPAEVRAMERERERNEAERLTHATWTYVATAGADWAVTAACLDRRCQDRTHVGLFLHGVKPKAAVPIGLAIDAAIVIAVRQWLAPEHPRIAEVTLYVLSGARLAVLTDKITALRRR